MHPLTCWQVALLQGDVCNTCNNPFVRSFLTFEPLPLLQFQLAPHITDQQVLPARQSKPCVRSVTCPCHPSQALLRDIPVWVVQHRV